MHTRRTFLKIAGLAAARQALGQTTVTPSTKFAETPVLRIGYEESGAAEGFPIVLLHGFPDDAHAFDEVTSPLVKAGYRTRHLVSILFQHRTRPARIAGKPAGDLPISMGDVVSNVAFQR